MTVTEEVTDTPDICLSADGFALRTVTQLPIPRIPGEISAHPAQHRPFALKVDKGTSPAHAAFQ